jgi:hypothetical protein
MSQTIISRTISAATDKRAKITNGNIFRKLAMGNNWTKIRIGLQMSFDGSATVSGTPRFAVGLQSGIINSYGAGPDNFLGVRFNSSMSTLDWTSDTVNYYRTSVAPVVTKKIGGTDTDGSNLGSNVYFSSAPATARTGFLIEITKGSPNYTVSAAFASSAAAGKADLTDADFANLLEMTNMSDASTVVSSGYNASSGISLAFDQVAGVLDTFVVYWSKTVPPLEISAVGIRKVS